MSNNKTREELQDELKNVMLALHKFYIKLLEERHGVDRTHWMTAVGMMLADCILNAQIALAVDKNEALLPDVIAGATDAARGAFEAYLQKRRSRL